MKKLLITICATLFAASGAAIAAPNYTPPPPPQQQQAVDVSNSDVEKFAEIYVDVETTRSELAAEMSTAADPEEAQEVQARMRDEIIGAIEDHGWSLDKYNEIAQAITADPELKDKALELINEKAGS